MEIENAVPFPGMSSEVKRAPIFRQIFSQRGSPKSRVSPVIKASQKFDGVSISVSAILK